MEEEESTEPEPAPSRLLRGLYLDLRSIALFRVALGLCLIADLLLRIPQIDEFYDDRGAYPREAVVGAMRGSWALSVHFISGLWGVELLLFLLALMFAIGFTLGYRTRLCAVVSWFLVGSMQVRAGIVLHGGDDLIRLLLFWCMFFPLNGRASLDRTLNPDAKPLPLAHLSPGSLALIFQICAMYWYTAAEKMHPVWLTERAAVYYTLSLDQFTKPLGHFLLGYSWLLPLLTTATLILEFFGPILALLPFRTAAVPTARGRPVHRLSCRARTHLATRHVPVAVRDGLAGFPAPGILGFPWHEAHRNPLTAGSAPAASGHAVSTALPASSSEAALRPGNERPRAGLPHPDRGRPRQPPDSRVYPLRHAGGESSSRSPNWLRPGGCSHRRPGVTTAGTSWRASPVAGRDVDVWQGGVPDYGKPEDFGAYFRNPQWLKYLENIRRDNFSGYRAVLRAVPVPEVERPTPRHGAGGHAPHPVHDGVHAATRPAAGAVWSRSRS